MGRLAGKGGRGVAKRQLRFLNVTKRSSLCSLRHSSYSSCRHYSSCRSSEAIASLFRPIDEAYCVRFATPANSQTDTILTVPTSSCRVPAAVRLNCQAGQCARNRSCSGLLIHPSRDLSVDGLPLRLAPGTAQLYWMRHDAFLLSFVAFYSFVAAGVASECHLLWQRMNRTQRIMAAVCIARRRLWLCCPTTPVRPNSVLPRVSWSL